MEEYFDTLMGKYPDGKMEVEDFIKTFSIAFPTRPEEKVQKLAAQLANVDGKICKCCFFAHNSGKTSHIQAS